jgi:hypothetical protein
MDFFSILGAVNRSTVGIGGDEEGSRMAALVCHEVSDLGYQVTCSETHAKCCMNACCLYSSAINFISYPSSSVVVRHLLTFEHF